MCFNEHDMKQNDYKKKKHRNYMNSPTKYGEINVTCN